MADLKGNGRSGNLPRWPCCTGTGRDKGRKSLGIQADVCGLPVQFFLFLVQIMRFLSKNRKKKTRARFILVQINFFVDGG
jgi:hypothetical protein